MKVLLFLLNYCPKLTEVSMKLSRMKFKKKRRKGKKGITHDDVLEQQFNALVSRQENMALKKIRIGDISLGAESVARGHHYPH